MRRIICLLIVLIAIIGCSSVVSAGWFDFGSNGPIGGEILNSTFVWETDSVVSGVEGDDVSTTPGGITSFRIDENGESDVSFETEDVNNFNGTLEVKITNATDDQIKQLKEFSETIGVDLDVYVDNNQFKDPIYFFAEEFDFDGNVLSVNFTSEHCGKFVDGEGSAQIKSGNLTFSPPQGDKVQVLF